MTATRSCSLHALVLCVALAGIPATTAVVADEETVEPQPGHREDPVPPPAVAPVPREQRATEAVESVMRGNFESVQVNVDASGANIIGDAANEPSMAIDPTNPDNIVVGWRQFDTITSDFRQAGYAYSHDGGATWTFPGVLEPGQFRSDPVLEADSAGVFYYNSLSTVTTAEMFISMDKGVTWTGPIPARGGDKNWMAVDATGSMGDGHIYPVWNSQFTCCAAGTDYTRSTDGGQTYPGPYSTPNPKPKWGTIVAGPDGEVYFVGANVSGSGHVVLRSDSMKDSAATPVFEQALSVNLGGNTGSSGTPNPGGLLGQVWVDVDRTTGPSRGNVYVLGSVNPAGSDPMDVHLIRSTDGGQTWTSPVRVNDDPGDAWQWFGIMSVAPNGRIDVLWNDTRSDPSGIISELYYAYSTDQGTSFSSGIPVSPPFDSTVGHPQQNKIGDYYQSRSDNDGAAVIYSATFNGEQDLYFLRVGDCNANGQHDSLDVAGGGGSTDCNTNGVPDECEPDCNVNGIADGCDLTAGTSEDCNLNLIPDECDVTSGAVEDCNLDGRPDECDVTLDLETDEGWLVGALDDTATTGIWERVNPVGTEAQPEDDHTLLGVTCFVTGQGAVGGGLGDNDVDGGKTTLVSPVLDLSGLSDPAIGYWRWYSNDKGAAPGADVFQVDISNDDGASWTPVETVGPSGPETVGGWLYHSVPVSDFVTPTAQVRLRFIAEDAGSGSVVEAAVDDVLVIDCVDCTANLPAEPQGLLVDKAAGDPDTAELSWSVAVEADDYNVYRGAQRDASDLACFQAGVVGTSIQDDGQVPTVGTGLFYVVSSGNCAGESPLGSGRVPVAPCP
jgi:hypothetical protein